MRGTSMRQGASSGWWDEWVHNPERRELVAIAVLAFILGYLLASRYGLSAYSLWTRWQLASGVEPWRAKALRADPPVGERVALPPLPSIDGKRVHLPLPQGYTALVFITDPRSCQANSTLRGIRERQATGRFQNLRVFVVVPTFRPAQARQVWQTWRTDFPVLLDPEAKLAKQLNVVFDNRAYLFDPQGKLLYRTSYLQKGEEIERDVLRIIGVK
ncbi:MAG: hypothetical protein RMM08_13950 [Armatimonadota bacterium]|nr:hypothetical protein [Armatimonadota bacterium]